MSKGNSWETDLLKLLFTATTLANVAINATSSPITNIYISLHTGDPGEAGDQTTSEAGYTSYARVAVARTSGGWTVASGVSQNAGTISFPACTGSSSTCTYFGVGRDITGAGYLFYSGALTSPSSLAVSSGITPSFAAGALTVSED